MGAGGIQGEGGYIREKARIVLDLEDCQGFKELAEALFPGTYVVPANLKDILDGGREVRVKMRDEALAGRRRAFDDTNQHRQRRGLGALPLPPRMRVGVEVSIVQWFTAGEVPTVS